MSGRVVLTACVALLLAVVLRWLMPGDSAPDLGVTAPDTRFDYTLSEFTARFRDENDRLELALSGPRLEHISETRIALLDQPRFHIEPEGADWQGRAGRGRILRDQELLLLEQDVELRHPHPDGEITVLAQTLQHDRSGRTITSDRTVEILQAGSWLRAGGLTIHLDDNSIELYDQINGQLLPSAIERPGSGPGAGSDG